jgi:acyl-CoA dehydrogenase
MLMNVNPIPTVSDRINEIRKLTATIVNNEILPNENLIFGRQAGHRLTEGDQDEARRVREQIKEKVKQAGRWAPTFPRSTAARGSVSSNTPT